MTIYVDALLQHAPPKDAATRRTGAKHGHRWCHLMCDPGEEGELHAFATRLGLKRAWFQASPPASKPHYDLTPPSRAEAVRLGAVELNGKAYAAYFQRWREHRAKLLEELGA